MLPKPRRKPSVVSVYMHNSMSWTDVDLFQMSKMCHGYVNMPSVSQQIWYGQEKHKVFQFKFSKEIQIVFPEQGEKNALRNSTLQMPPLCILFHTLEDLSNHQRCDFDRKISSIFPLILNQNPEQCAKEKLKEIGTILNSNIPLFVQCYYSLRCPNNLRLRSFLFIALSIRVRNERN